MAFERERLVVILVTYALVVTAVQSIYLQVAKSILEIAPHV